MDILISIIVPVYNAERYLKRCLDSIVEQTYNKIEILLINDGSNDNSGEICDCYKESDDRIKVIHTVNQGVSTARNIGIENARGKYICFVDSDDYIEKEYVEALYKKIVKWDAELSICNLRSVIGKTTNEVTVDCEVINFDNMSAEFFLEINKKYLLYAPFNKMYQSSIIKNEKIRYSKDICYGEDLLFNLTYLMYINRITFVNETKYNYIVDNTGSLSQRYRKDRYQNGKKLFEALYSFFKNKHFLTKANEKYLYERLFDDAYNAICETCINNEDKIAIKELSIIVHDSEVEKAMKLLELKSYSKIIVLLIKTKKFSLLYHYIKIRSRRKK